MLLTLLAAYMVHHLDRAAIALRLEPCSDIDRNAFA
ncbi:MAG: hypothetical protein QOG17_1923 [Gammaproteobacteria bacterium]|nr:hypothetical protein [Gammaproteobacteria bacterium]